ncbi:hypothetical protein MMC13_000145 [Lambiella insularis]|nr:hypothetical protein [Lambiella insularis]
MSSHMTLMTAVESYESPFSSGTVTPRPASPQYRPSKGLPYELCEHCLIYFEEGLYIQALNLLLSLTVAGGSTSSIKPAFVPSAQHLAFISTLAIHPSFTTRARAPEKLQAADLALKYLRLIIKTVGSLNCNVNNAFTYLGAGIASRRGGSSRRTTGVNVSLEKEDFESIDSEFANVDSVWARAEDFWHAVGWAFNCSVAYIKRWERWQMWLDFMIAVLEDDWYTRDDSQRKDSLIIKYINAEGEVSVGEKRIVRAIFADGSSRSLSEFREIWKNETKERKVEDPSKEQRKATVKLNIEEGEYGDYFESSNEEEDDDIDSLTEITSNTPYPLAQALPIVDGSHLLGGPQALHLRLRLLGLLASVAIEFPDKFVPFSTLYDIYLTHIRPLPLPTFALVIAPPSLEPFSLPAACFLTQYIATSVISSSAPLPKEEDLTQEILETSFLPWAANTTSISDNAKLGACVETLVRLYDGFAGLRWNEKLQRCVEDGIKAREGKATRERKRKGEAGAGTDGDRAWLEASGQRIRGVLSMAQRRCS